MKTFSFGRSKSTTLGFWTAQRHQTCVGAYKRAFKFEGTWFGGAKMFAQVAYHTIRLPILLADRPEPYKCYHATIVPIWKSEDLGTYNHGNLEIWRSTNLQALKINASQPGGPQGAGGFILGLAQRGEAKVCFREPFD